MSLTQLRTFIEVYRRHALSEAARVLGMTQPAASQHIASLEAQLGHPLFDRHARGVRPTAIADDLAAAIGDSLDVAETALATARARSAQIAGTVHIAAPSDLLSEMVAPRLGPLLEAGFNLRLHIGGREALYAMLLDDKVHLGLTASLPTDGRLAYRQLGAERLIAVAAPSVAQSIAALPLVEALNRVPHLAYDLDRPLIRAWLTTNCIELSRLPTLTAPDLCILRAGLRAGFGWTVLPDYLVTEDRARQTLVEIAAPLSVPTNPFYLVWAKAALRHPRVAAARNALVKALDLQETSSPSLRANPSS
jgi:DNA-binding transcriptional LysR family regulator